MTNPEEISWHVEKVLDWLDRRCLVRLDDLPKGVRGDGSDNPIARAIATNRRNTNVWVSCNPDGWSASSSSWLVEWEGDGESNGSEYRMFYSTEPPALVQAWLSEFERGAWPQYEEAGQ